MQKTCVRSLGWEDPLEEEMAIHSRILAWRMPWTEEPGGLYSPWGRKEPDTMMSLHFLFALLFITAVTLQDHGSVDGPEVTVAKASVPYPWAKYPGDQRSYWSQSVKLSPYSLVYCLVFKTIFLPFFHHFVSCSVVGFVTPVDCSPPDYSVHGVLQARKPEWVAITNSFWQLVGQLENF